jgi:hypothetical protein
MANPIPLASQRRDNRDIDELLRSGRSRWAESDRKMQVTRKVARVQGMRLFAPPRDLPSESKKKSLSLAKENFA